MGTGGLPDMYRISGIIHRMNLMVLEAFVNIFLCIFAIICVHGTKPLTQVIVTHMYMI